jgi:pantothenate synthetase
MNNKVVLKISEKPAPKYRQLTANMHLLDSSVKKYLPTYCYLQLPIRFRRGHFRTISGIIMTLILVIGPMFHCYIHKNILIMPEFIITQIVSDDRVGHVRYVGCNNARREDKMR